MKTASAYKKTLLTIGLAAFQILSCTGSSGLGTSAADSYYCSLYEAGCVQMIGCGVHFENDSCVVLQSDNLPALTQELLASIEAGRVEFSKTATAECFASIATLPCLVDWKAFALSSPSCDAVLTGLQLQGELCDYDGECATGNCLGTVCGMPLPGAGELCPSGRCASGNICSSGRCETVIAGSPCNPFDETRVVGFFCRGMPSVWMEAQVGMPCGFSNDCPGYMRCNFDTLICELELEEGASCDPLADRCQLNQFYCDADTAICKRRPGLGQSCEEIACAFDLYCDPIERTCVDRQLPGAYEQLCPGP